MFGIFRKTVNGVRRDGGGWTNGEWSAPTNVAISIQASVQPADKDQVELLPGGRKLTGAYAIFTNDTLQITKEATAGEASPGTMGDMLVIDGSVYEVMARERWQNNLINHNVYIVSRVIEMAQLYAIQDLLLATGADLTDMAGVTLQALAPIEEAV